MNQRKITKTPDANKVFRCPKCGGDHFSSCMVPVDKNGNQINNVAKYKTGDYKRIYHCRGDDTRAGCGWFGWADDCLVQVQPDIQEQEDHEAEPIYCWGVFCEAALQNDPKAPPKYKARTASEAKALVEKADQECQSHAKHLIKRFDSKFD